jgi:1-acyl-sn-glycerol-3-phosphate acyltransferase
LIIKASHKRFYDWFYGFYAKRAIKLNFHNVHVDLPNINQERSLLVLANHHSWWDGFWVMRLNQLYWNKEFYVMMLREQLLKHRSFRKAGAYSVNPGSRSVLESLKYTNELLFDHQNMVLLFPQGEIQSQHIIQPKFEHGVNHIIDNLSNTDVMLLNMYTDFFSQKHISLYCYGKMLKDRTQVETEFVDFYLKSRLKQGLCTG